MCCVAFQLSSTTDDTLVVLDALAQGSAAGQGLLGFGLCDSTCTMSAVELGFFDDAPWGRVPEAHRAEIVLCGEVRGGLLGGSSTPSTQKSSKLAALAKKRKEKAQATAAAGDQKASVSLLSRLSQKAPPPPTTLPEKDASEAVLPPPPPPPPPRSPSPALVSEPQEQNKSSLALDQPDDTPIPDAPATFEELLAAAPSSFAKSIFGERITLRHELSVADGVLFFVSGNGVPAKAAAAFSGPSPDDIVVAAQGSSKGIISRGC